MFSSDDEFDDSEFDNWDGPVDELSIILSVLEKRDCPKATQSFKPSSKVVTKAQTTIKEGESFDNQRTQTHLYEDELEKLRKINLSGKYRFPLRTQVVSDDPTPSTTKSGNSCKSMYYDDSTSGVPDWTVRMFDEINDLMYDTDCSRHDEISEQAEADIATVKGLVSMTISDDRLAQIVPQVRNIGNGVTEILDPHCDSSPSPSRSNGRSSRLPRMLPLDHRLSVSGTEYVSIPSFADERLPTFSEAENLPNTSHAMSRQSKSILHHGHSNFTCYHSLPRKRRRIQLAMERQSNEECKSIVSTAERLQSTSAGMILEVLRRGHWLTGRAPPSQERGDVE